MRRPTVEVKRAGDQHEAVDQVRTSQRDEPGCNRAVAGPEQVLARPTTVSKNAIVSCAIVLKGDRSRAEIRTSGDRPFFVLPANSGP